MVRRSTGLLDQFPASAFAGLAPEVREPGGAVSSLGRSAGPMSAIRRTLSTEQSGVIMAADQTPEGNSRAISDMFTDADWDQIVERVVHRVEERVVDEMARRGRRNGGGVL